MHTIDELAALEAAATPGPWEAISTYLATGEPYPMVTAPDGRVCDALAGARTDEQCMVNARFIAAARNALPELLSLLSSFRAAHAALRAAQNAYAKQENQETLAALRAAEQAYAAALGRLVG